MFIGIFSSNIDYHPQYTGYTPGTGIKQERKVFWWTLACEQIVWTLACVKIVHRQMPFSWLFPSSIRWQLRRWDKTWLSTLRWWETAVLPWPGPSTPSSGCTWTSRTSPRPSSTGATNHMSQNLLGSGQRTGEYNTKKQGNISLTLLLKSHVWLQAAQLWGSQLPDRDGRLLTGALEPRISWRHTPHMVQTILHGYLGLRTSLGEMNLHPRLPTRSNQPTKQC